MLQSADLFLYILGLILILQPADSEISKSASKNDRLVVANTHLLFNPKVLSIYLSCHNVLS